MMLAFPARTHSFRRYWGVITTGLALFLSAAPTQGASPFTVFESGQVRPLALSPNRTHLYAVNTPDNRLEIFRVLQSGLVHQGSVMVGLQPVAVAARNNDEVWVVNHLSDSVSVVDVSNPYGARVVHTLLVGDEPRDIVFGGPGGGRAFITTAHRGQNIPFDPQFTTPGVGRADVWVFNASALGSSLGGNPLTILTLFTDTPRALAVTPNGDRVYAAGFRTGNQTTVVHRTTVDESGLGVPPPVTNFEGVPQPSTALIVKYNGTDWVDTVGRVWTDDIRFTLPDKDVFVIDAMTDPPAPVTSGPSFYPSVGTILYNTAVNPVNGKFMLQTPKHLTWPVLRGQGPLPVPPSAAMCMRTVSQSSAAVRSYPDTLTNTSIMALAAHLSRMQKVRRA